MSRKSARHISIEENLKKIIPDKKTDKLTKLIKPKNQKQKTDLPAKKTSDDELDLDDDILKQYNLLRYWGANMGRDNEVKKAFEFHLKTIDKFKQTSAWLTGTHIIDLRETIDITQAGNPTYTSLKTEVDGFVIDPKILVGDKKNLSEQDADEKKLINTLVVNVGTAIEKNFKIPKLKAAYALLKQQGLQMSNIRKLLGDFQETFLNKIAKDILDFFMNIFPSVQFIIHLLISDENTYKSKFTGSGYKNFKYVVVNGIHKITGSIYNKTIEILFNYKPSSKTPGSYTYYEMTRHLLFATIRNHDNIKNNNISNLTSMCNVTWNNINEKDKKIKLTTKLNEKSTFVDLYNGSPIIENKTTGMSNYTQKVLGIEIINDIEYEYEEEKTNQEHINEIASAKCSSLTMNYKNLVVNNLQMISAKANSDVNSINFSSPDGKLKYLVYKYLVNKKRCPGKKDDSFLPRFHILFEKLKEMELDTVDVSDTSSVEYANFNLKIRTLKSAKESILRIVSIQLFNLGSDIPEPATLYTKTEFDKLNAIIAEQSTQLDFFLKISAEQTAKDEADEEVKKAEDAVIAAKSAQDAAELLSKKKPQNTGYKKAVADAIAAKVLADDALLIAQQKLEDSTDALAEQTKNYDKAVQLIELLSIYNDTLYKHFKDYVYYNLKTLTPYKEDSELLEVFPELTALVETNKHLIKQLESGTDDILKFIDQNTPILEKPTQEHLDASKALKIGLDNLKVKYGPQIIKRAKELIKTSNYDEVKGLIGLISTIDIDDEFIYEPDDTIDLNEFPYILTDIAKAKEKSNLPTFLEGLSSLTPQPYKDLFKGKPKAKGKNEQILGKVMVLRSGKIIKGGSPNYKTIYDLYDWYIQYLENDFFDKLPILKKKMAVILGLNGFYVPNTKKKSIAINTIVDDIKAKYKNNSQDYQCAECCKIIFDMPKDDDEQKSFSFNEMFYKLSKGSPVIPFGCYPYLSPDSLNTNTFIFIFSVIKYLALSFPNSPSMRLYFITLCISFNRDYEKCITQKYDIVKDINRKDFFDKLYNLETDNFKAYEVVRSNHLVKSVINETKLLDILKEIQPFVDSIMDMDEQTVMVFNEMDIETAQEIVDFKSDDNIAYDLAQTYLLLNRIYAVNIDPDKIISEAWKEPSSPNRYPYTQALLSRRFDNPSEHNPYAETSAFEGTVAFNLYNGNITRANSSRTDDQVTGRPSFTYRPQTPTRWTVSGLLTNKTRRSVAPMNMKIEGGSNTRKKRKTLRKRHRNK